MAKIICAHPGTGRVQLFHNLRKEGTAVLTLDHKSIPKDINKLDHLILNTDVIIFAACHDLIQRLLYLDLVFDLVYPMALISPMQFVTPLAMEGFSLQEIHKATFSWYDDLKQYGQLTSRNIHHIVLDEGQTLLDTHGIKHEKIQRY